MMSRWDPFAEIAWRPEDRERWFAPPVDIVEEDEAFVVRVELPGVRPEDVSVDIDDHVMLIQGERKPDATIPRGGVRHRIERPYGAFSRSFTVPESADGRETVAVMADGVLTLRIPKREPDSAAPPSLPPLKRAS